MRKLLRLFTDNWGLKLLALALAIVIYHSLKSTDTRQIDTNDRKFFQKPR